MEKEKALYILNEKFDLLISWMNDHDDDQFEVSKREAKWTTAQHLDHLIKSTAPITKAMKLPKLVLKWKFGTCNREERTYEETYIKYYTALSQSEGVAPSPFAPRVLKNNMKTEILERLNKVRNDLNIQVSKWSEKNLSKYILPHPLLGRMTIRELVYFTAFHTEHHHKILKEFH